MHSYLIVGNNKEVILKNIGNIANIHNSKVLNFDINGISDVKQLIQITRYESKKTLLICIQNIHLISEEASNSLLKLIEEPNENIKFALTSSNLKSVLPTIISRCEIVQTINEFFGSASKTFEELLKSDTNSKMLMVEKIKSKEEAGEFANQIQIDINRYVIEKNYSRQVEKIADAAIILSKSISQNGNPTLHLTKFILDISN